MKARVAVGSQPTLKVNWEESHGASSQQDLTLVKKLLGMEPTAQVLIKLSTTRCINSLMPILIFKEKEVSLLLLIQTLLEDLITTIGWGMPPWPWEPIWNLMIWDFQVLNKKWRLMSDGSEGSKIKLIQTDSISESILNSNYQTDKFIKEDGADLKLMGQDWDQLLWWHSVKFFLTTINLHMFKVTWFQLLNSILIGFSTTGLQMDAIYGKKLEALTFSGTEAAMFTLWGFVNNFSQELEIPTLLQDVHQLNLKSATLWVDIGLEHLLLSQTTDKKTQQLFTLSHHLMFTHSLMIKSPKLLKLWLWLSAQNIKSTNKILKTVNQEFWWEDIQEIHMPEEIHGNYWLLFLPKLSIKVPQLHWLKVSKNKKINMLGTIFWTLKEAPLQFNLLKPLWTLVMLLWTDFINTLKMTEDILLNKLEETQDFKLQLKIWLGVMLIFLAPCNKEKNQSLCLKWKKPKSKNDCWSLWIICPFFYITKNNILNK